MLLYHLLLIQILSPEARLLVANGIKADMANVYKGNMATRQFIKGVAQ